ncbi:hypothetical protein S1361_00895 [Streptomyces cyanogenus]|uniref:Transposase n=1 Tax=Streptomyces cyanogenus TaxID=80860 RepID=A0ABX7THJ5_STRCY|nr:hypothetical protein S1361_00895 [Streptomyces cyanogenus]
MSSLQYWMCCRPRRMRWTTCSGVLIRWAIDDTWEKVFTAVLATADAVDDIGWTVSVDSTVVRAHQHAAGALNRGLRAATSRTMMSDAPAAG